ncbi:MAG: TetR/AcrR family transcriptional regulator [Solirubrobacteraceae bacterium]
MPDDRTDLRATLLRAAEEEIAQVGVGAVSLRAIARRAGVSHQAPGHVFRDSAGLFTAVAGVGYDALSTALERERAQADDPRAGLIAVGTAYVRFACRHDALFSVIVRPELWDPTDPRLAASRARAFAVLDDAVAEACAAGWGGGVDQRTLALLCWSSVHGLASLARDGVLAIEVPEATPEQLADLLSTTLIDGLATGGTSAASSS